MEEKLRFADAYEKSEIEKFVKRIAKKKMRYAIGVAIVASFIFVSIFGALTLSLPSVSGGTGKRNTSGPSSAGIGFMIMLFIVVAIAVGACYFYKRELNGIYEDVRAEKFRIEDVTILGCEKYSKRNTYAEDSDDLFDTSAVFFLETRNAYDKKIRYRVAKEVFEKYDPGKAALVIKWERDYGLYGEKDLFIVE